MNRRRSPGSKSPSPSILSSIPSDILSIDWLNQFQNPSPSRSRSHSSPEAQSLRQASPANVAHEMYSMFQTERTPSPPPNFNLQDYVLPSRPAPKAVLNSDEKRQKDIERKRRARALLAEAAQRDDVDAILKHQQENERKKQSNARLSQPQPKPPSQAQKERHRINAMNSYWRKVERNKKIQEEAAQGNAEAIAALQELEAKKRQETKRKTEHTRKSRSTKRRAMLGMPPL